MTEPIQQEIAEIKKQIWNLQESWRLQFSDSYDVSLRFTIRLEKYMRRWFIGILLVEVALTIFVLVVGK